MQITPTESQYRLTSPSGFEFDLDRSTTGAGQLLQGTNNAFDGLGRLQVNGVDYAPAQGQVGATDDGGRTLLTPSVTMSGLTVSREITVPSAGAQDFARTVDVFTNPTGSAITIPVRIVGNLGSDSATTVFATSDGNTLVEPTDTWFGTDDGDGTGSPASIHFIRGPYGLAPTGVSVTGDNVEWTYNVTIAAGATQRIAGYTVLGQRGLRRSLRSMHFTRTMDLLINRRAF